MERRARRGEEVRKIEGQLIEMEMMKEGSSGERRTRRRGDEEGRKGSPKERKKARRYGRWEGVERKYKGKEKKKENG